MREDAEFRELVEEPPGGCNHGRAASEDPEGDGGRHVPLGVEETQAVELIRDGGYVVVESSGGSSGHTTYGTRDAGLRAHRGVLHPDDYVDHETLAAAVEHELEFSIDDVRAVYRQGRLSDDQRELRGRIDARLLALSRSGANLVLLGRVLGFPTKPDAHGGSCRVITNAIRRARATEASS